MRPLESVPTLAIRLITPPAPATPIPPPPIATRLGYRQAPLHFPTQAIRQNLQGTVILRVLVDANGKPLQVVIDQSSGHALLDRSAR